MLHERLTVVEAVKRCKLARGSPVLVNMGFQHELVRLAEREQLLGPTPKVRAADAARANGRATARSEIARTTLAALAAANGDAFALHSAQAGRRVSKFR